MDAEVGLGGGEKAALCARVLYEDNFSLVPCKNVYHHCLLRARAFKYRIAVCPKSINPFNMMIYYIKWVKTSWTYSIFSILLLYWFELNRILKNNKI